MLEDKELVFQYVRKGDVKSFSALVERHSSWMTGYLRGLLGGLGDAEDALQEVWLKVLKSIAHYRGGVFRAYLVHAVRSVAYSRLAARRRPISAGRVEVDSVEISDDSANPADRAENRDAAALIRRAISNLPEREREVVLMRVEGGLAFDEIAKILEVPLNTVHCWMRRARLAVKESMKGVGYV